MVAIHLPDYVAVIIPSAFFDAGIEPATHSNSGSKLHAITLYFELLTRPVRESGLYAFER